LGISFRQDWAGLTRHLGPSRYGTLSFWLKRGMHQVGSHLCTGVLGAQC